MPNLAKLICFTLYIFLEFFLDLWLDEPIDGATRRQRQLDVSKRE